MIVNREFATFFICSTSTWSGSGPVPQQAAHRDELTNVISVVIGCKDELSEYGLTASRRSSRE